MNTLKKFKIYIEMKRKMSPLLLPLPHLLLLSERDSRPVSLTLCPGYFTYIYS